MTKEEIQNEGVSLTDLHNYIIYEWATGTGKSLLAIRIIEKLGGKWNIVIAETNHELNWILEFKKHHKEHLLDNVVFFCYQSLHKNLEEENYIFDECHHLQSEIRLGHLGNIHLNNLKRFIGLSATLTKSQKLLIETSIGEFHVHKISLSQAIEWELLPEPTVYLVQTKLNNTIRNLKFHYKKDSFVLCTEEEYYNRLSSRIEFFKNKYFQSNGEFDKIKWLRSANDRKKFLSSTKTKYAREILDYLENKRLICFTSSIEQSEELSNGLSIHSKISKKDRELLLTNFNDGEINQLFATGMLKEGQNLENIEVGVIIQLDNVERYFVQISGRSMRALYPIQIVMFVKGTQDEVYVSTALQNFNMEYVKVVTTETLKNFI